MIVGVFCARLSGNGPRTRTRTLLESFERFDGGRDLDVRLVTGVDEAVELPGVDVHRVVEATPAGLARTAAAVRRAFADADVVHVPVNWRQAAFVRLCYRGPLVVGPGVKHGLCHRRLLGWLDVDHVIDTHEYVQWLWEVDGFDATTIYPAVDRRRFRRNGASASASAFAPVADADEVLFVGRLTEPKGAHLLPAVGERLDADLVVVGDGDGPLRGRIERSAHCRFEGPVPNADLPAYYRRATVALVLSELESFSLVALEATACGTPVVSAVERGSMRRLFRGRHCYEWCEREPAAIADAVGRLLDEPDRRRARVANGRRAIVEMGLSADRQLERTAAVYEEVAG